ncbi:MAG: Txe/YoeB family addiction module toxin [Oscillospiraceae bacterium]
MFKLAFTKQAIKDIEYLKQANLTLKSKKLIEILKSNPFKTPPPYEKLSGDLKGLYSRRINIQHRLVYEVFEKDHIVKIIRMWKHYE